MNPNESEFLTKIHSTVKELDIDDSDKDQVMSFVMNLIQTGDETIQS
jgi:hypothetical protein